MATPGVIGGKTQQDEKPHNPFYPENKTQPLQPRPTIKEPMDSPPQVEIIKPKNGTTTHKRHTNISIKCTDDNGIIYFKLQYGARHYTHTQTFYLGSAQKTYYFNGTTRKIEQGYNWMIAIAYDETGNIGTNTSNFYYNASKDTYPPEIDIWRPNKGYLYILNEFIRYYPSINYSIILGKFNIVVVIADYEGNLQNIKLYLDERIIINQTLSNATFKGIQWDCHRPLLGMHVIKIVATDTYGNSATEQLKCFVINFI
jgi:hypothetical protein